MITVLKAFCELFYAISMLRLYITIIAEGLRDKIVRVFCEMSETGQDAFKNRRVFQNRRKGTVIVG